MEEPIKQCPRCLFTSDFAKIGEHQCEYCDIHDTLERQAIPADFEKQLAKVRKRKGKYNCIIGISGGKDSSAMLYAAVKWWRLKPLVIHFDNHWNTPVAESNMKNLIQRLDIDAIRINVNKKEYDNLNESFLRAGVPDADIPNDIAMTKLMYETANRYGIKYILNGHDFREEGSTPRGWTYMDAEYIRSVYGKHTGKHLINYPLFTFKDQIIYSLKGIKQIRPFHYISDRTNLESEMIAFCGWQSYGGKHAENLYTEFVGSVLLPNKFGIDKRIVYLSAQVRSGMITKENARIRFNYRAPIDMSKFPAEWLQAIGSEKRTHKDFKTYNFKKYRPLIWLLYKMKVVPYTFFKKYAF